MTKYMRKCKGIGEIAVMEVAPVGVRTRAGTLAMAAASEGTAKRRKVDSRELQLSSSYLQLQSRRCTVFITKSEHSGQIALGDRCSGPDSEVFLPSRSLSNGSIELASESLRSVDPECSSCEMEVSTSFGSKQSSNFTSEKKDRRSSTNKMTPTINVRTESDDLESTASKPEAVSSQKSTADKKPSEADLEKFFSSFTKPKNDHLKHFSDKYNFDFENDVPLEGRYQWARVKP